MVIRGDKKIDIKDFKSRIDNKEFDSIRNEIFDRTIKLAYKIFELKNINIVDYEDYDGHFMKLKENDNEEDIKKYVPLKEEKENIDIIDDYEIEDDLDIEEEISDE